MAARKRLLLHTCCAQCSVNAVKLLLQDYEVTMFFSNSNIFPYSEYIRRLEGSKRVAELCSLQHVEDAYMHSSWLEAVRGLENEPEKGLRCRKCFGFSLARASRYAEKHGFEHFTTTLTTSPHKDSGLIFSLGRKFGRFLRIDLKKKDGFRKSCGLARAHGLYRQDYCGCEFSLKAP